jgi:hypothetical protein
MNRILAPRLSVNIVFKCLLLASLALGGCSRRVSPDSVLGTYTATYPFGKGVLTIQPDGNFIQQVTIEDQVPVTVQGSWEFDSAHSTLTLHGVMPIGDEFDKLRSDWKRKEDFPRIPVERIWFRVTIELSENHPYIKQ